MKKEFLEHFETFKDSGEARDEILAVEPINMDVPCLGGRRGDSVAQEFRAIVMG